jgi:hypothetical protein
MFWKPTKIMSQQLSDQPNAYYHRTMANKPAAAKPIPSPYSSRTAAFCVTDVVEDEPDCDD